MQDQLAYEVARAVHQLNRHSLVPLQVFVRLVESAESPMLRILSALQVVSAYLRYHHAPHTARQWLSKAHRLACELDQEPAWLAHLGRSRYNRAAALFYVSDRDTERVGQHLRAALHENDALGDMALDEVTRHYHHEDRRLVLEAFLKLDMMTGSSASPEQAGQQVQLLDPYEPDSLFTVGSYHVKAGDWSAASHAFSQAAQSGTVRGAWASCNAGRCLELLGKFEEAARAYRLALDLDPAARTPAERLQQLDPVVEASS